MGIQEAYRRREGEELKVKVITEYFQNQVRQHFIKMEENKITGTYTHKEWIGLREREL